MRQIQQRAGLTGDFLRPILASAAFLGLEQHLPDDRLSIWIAVRYRLYYALQMPNRVLLRRQMRHAWAETIRSAYLDQVISSERALQVYFTARLMDLFWEENVKRRVFVEPKMQLDTGARVHPDLLVCNSRSIIGVVELKYQPKMRPRYEKDFATFELLAAHGTGIEIENHRYRGPDSGGGRYALSADPMYVWAGIYRGPERDISGCETDIDPGQLLVLHAATNAETAPKISAGSGSRVSEL